MDNFMENSALDIPAKVSSTFAAMEVPLFKFD